MWDSKKNESSSSELTRFLAPRDLLVLLPGVGTPSAIYERGLWTESKSFIGIQFDEMLIEDGGCGGTETRVVEAG